MTDYSGLSTERKRITSLHILFYKHYVRKCFTLVYKKNVVMVTDYRYNVAFLFGCGEFYEGGPRAL
jgi:hypothetical protein